MLGSVGVQQSFGPQLHEALQRSVLLVIFGVIILFLRRAGICMYVWIYEVYVRMYVCAYLYIYECSCLLIQKMYAFMYVCIYVCMYFMKRD